jgi:tetratricopeptide (TPR) repeat protein
LFLQLIVAALKVRGWVRGARSSDDRRVLLACERARRVLGIAMHVDVLVSKHVNIPVMVGVFRPRILLPASASRWSDDRLGVVLLHELAHAQRRDGLWMLVSRAVAAGLWFHPLVWILSRQVRRESERACDDAVLTAGVRGSEYAHHLIAIARSTRFDGVLPGTAVAFAARSSLERRIASILTAAPRRTPSRRVVASLATLSLAVAVTVAVTQPTEVVSAQLSPVESMAIDAGRQMAEPAGRPVIAASQREYVKAKSQHKEFVVADRSRSREIRSQYNDASELYDRGRYKEAAALYETAAREGHRSDTAWYNAACCWAMGGESAKALDALQASFDEGFDRLRYYAEDTDLDSLRGDPRFRKFMDGVMNSDVAKRQRRSALREFEYLEKQKTVDEGDWNSVGVDLMRTGDYPNAETAFDREYKNTGRGTALYNMACLKAVSGKPDDALTYLDRAIRAGSGDPDHMVEDPDLRTLHDRDRFDQLVDFADDMQLQNHDSWSW